VVLDDQLFCNANITSVARSCRIALYNIRRIRPFLTCEAAQILVHAITLTTATLSWLDSLPPQAHPYNASGTQQRAWCSTLKNLLCKPPLPRPPLVPAGPTYLQTLVRPHGPTRAFRSTTRRLMPPSLRTGKHRSAKSQLLSVLARSCGMRSWLMSGWQSHSPASARDSPGLCEHPPAFPL